MKLVKQLLHEKGSTVWAVKPENTVFEGLQLLAAKDIGAVPVLDEQQRLVGMFSERDYARKVILKGKASKDMKIAELMTREVHCADPDQTIADCMSLMTEKRVRHLPVLDQEGHLSGIVTIGDVVKAMISDQALMINEMEKYISGSSY